MNANSLSALWAAIAPALGDHLWQSTLFAAAAGLLTLMVRKNHARARYGLWLAASMKFLIPFSWLAAIGSHLAWWRTSEVTNASLYFVAEEISRPFTQPVRSAVFHVATPIGSSGLSSLLPAVLAAMWLCGFAMVLFVWWARWQRISAVLRASVRLHEGREIQALRQQERATGMPQHVEMLVSRATLEPGIFGLARPVLLWPEGISEHLENAHLEAILAHELWHVRRRDNLAAAVHMVVEAMFWFHPLVWWLGARLVDERERACDEEVVEWGGERRIYAESILKVCEFCVGSPLACVSGVTGADLKKRMVHIMSEQVAQKLNFTKKLLLASAAFLAVVAPILFGLIHATPSSAQSQDESATTPAFELFSIKPSQSSAAMPTYAGTPNHMTRMMYGPNGFVANNVTLKTLIQEAYGVQASQISDGPDWLKFGTFDVVAKVDKSAGVQFGMGPNRAKGQLMLQAALAQYTKLVLHHETKELATYALVVGENGPKLQASPDGREPSMEFGGLKGPEGQVAHGMRMMVNGGQVEGIEAQGISIDDLAQHLSMQLGVPVLNKTGLKGNYDFNLQWTRDKNQPSEEGSGGNSAADSTPVSGSTEPSLFPAIQQQLGLKLVPQKQPMDVLVIDHIEKPAEN